ncbi:copper chaperone PCu(A)C [Ancylobacter sp. 6x-1]|uniref:Copper chaperone PCu(A)C n=1 Tax=Ancylobacter crimeensis TaxID=2579147 RepID=A0ABT0D9G9_9HYPH|nr:copper chaperone PCu(A)C [Ancylobacter crimeensis]MCK0196593.1 copper chaperone PCu(A)C [Ancylobacter crimeensis]
MNRSLSLGRTRLLAGLLGAATLLAPLVAQAHEYKIGALEIIHPWTRVTPNGAKVAGGYLIVENDGDTADRLIGATTEVAGRAEIHQMTVTDGVMTMRMLKDGAEVPAKGKLELAPGGYHIMMLDLKRPLVEGEKIKGTLTFAKAGTIAVDFKVESMKGPSPDAMKHDMKNMPATPAQ